MHIAQSVPARQTPTASNRPYLTVFSGRLSPDTSTGTERTALGIVCYKQTVLEFAHVVYLTFLPSIGVGIALGVAWRFVAVGPVRTALQWIASLLFFIPQPLALYLGAYSSGLRLYQQALLSIIGFGICVLMIAKLRSRAGQMDNQAGLLKRAAEWRQTDDEIRKAEMTIGALRAAQRPQGPRRRFALALGAVAMGGLGIYSGWTTVGDYALKHEIVTGTVDDARVIRGTRSPNMYEVFINRRGYNITLDILSQLRPGDDVEAEVGIASHTIVSIRRHVHRPQAGVGR